MKLKKIFVALLIFFLTGCTINYDLNIKEDSSVKENVMVEIEDTEDNYNKVINLFKFNNISSKKYSVKRDTKNIIINYSEKYPDIETYILESNLYKQYFGDIQVNRNNKSTSLDTGANFNSSNISDNKDNSINPKYMQINVISELPIIKENSDTTNENTYTWIYNGKQKQKNISIEYSNKSSDNIFKTTMVLTFIILSISLMSIIIYSRFKQTQGF